MARKKKNQTPNQESQEVNTEKNCEIQTTFNTDPISELVEDGEVENAV